MPGRGRLGRPLLWAGVAALVSAAVAIALVVAQDSGAPRIVQSDQEVLQGGQTVSYQLYSEAPSLVVDLPKGYTYRMESIMGEPMDRETPSTVVQVVITNAKGYKAWVTFHPRTGKELWRFIDGEGFFNAGERKALSDSGAGTSPNPLHDVFDRISESARLQE